MPITSATFDPTSLSPEMNESEYFCISCLKATVKSFLDVVNSAAWVSVRLFSYCYMYVYCCCDFCRALSIDSLKVVVSFWRSRSDCVNLDWVNLTQSESSWKPVNDRSWFCPMFVSLSSFGSGLLILSAKTSNRNYCSFKREFSWSSSESEWKSLFLLSLIERSNASSRSWCECRRSSIADFSWAVSF